MISKLLAVQRGGKQGYLLQLGLLGTDFANLPAIAIPDNSGNTYNGYLLPINTSSLIPTTPPNFATVKGWLEFGYQVGPPNDTNVYSNPYPDVLLRLASNQVLKFATEFQSFVGATDVTYRGDLINFSVPIESYAAQEFGIALVQPFSGISATLPALSSALSMNLLFTDIEEPAYYERVALPYTGKVQ